MPRLVISNELDTVIPFDSLIKANSKHSPGWIATARLKEYAGKMVNAWKLIQQGCENCPKSENVWLDAARLYVSDSTFLIT